MGISSLNQTEELLGMYPYFAFAEEQFQKSRKRTYPFEQPVNLSLCERDFEVIIHNCIKKAVLGRMQPEEALEDSAGQLGRYSTYSGKKKNYT